MEAIEGTPLEEAAWPAVGEFREDDEPELAEARARLTQIIELSSASVVTPLPVCEPESRVLKIAVGGIWPPAEGRDLIAEASAYAASQGESLWEVGLEESQFGTWAVSRLEPASFQDRDEAHKVLRRWARQLEKSRSLLSRDRWIAALETADEEWILVQGTRRQVSLQQLCHKRVMGVSERMLLLHWIYLGAAMMQATASLATSRLPLQVNRQGVGLQGDTPVYIGLFSTTGDRSKPPSANREVWRLLLEAINFHRCDAEEMQRFLPYAALRAPHLRPAAREVARVLVTLSRYRDAGAVPQPS